MKNIIEDCYQQSIALLLKNSSKYGILASSKTKKAEERNYLSIFGRDASICSFGMILSGDKKLIKAAENSVETLAKYQAKNGQIAFYVKPEKKEADFWFTGCIDSTLWWLLAIDFLKTRNSYDTKKLQTKIAKAINWLQCQEHQKFYLLQQNEASDWADIMPRSGFVLYTNALWYWVKKVYKLEKTEETKKYFNYVFDNDRQVSKKELDSNPRLEKFLKYIKTDKANPTYLSFVNHSFAGHEVDIFGNILAGMVGVADEGKVKKIIKYLKDKKANQPYPVKTVLQPIKKKDKLWRDYMSHLDLDLPNQYHNGGIWPFIGGFWSTFLEGVGDKKNALLELEKLAELNKIGDWGFNEWFDGKQAKPMGMSGQSWNAAMFIVAYHVIIKKGKKL
ncbi:glycoside hydrolase [Candidatus Parcubacteria bacterium]|nr:glycoside hydrolase [Patescibacteria group bacterium]MBU4309722.1 glycoside hydrolase [Patescibacteria group bacterium]MBU4431654.1 glycoside hydrolase [Patescibacteria group bacterium]MBU4577890.1 glycoside hydrolase [Patescibacteria group bacterium]MCG2696599.1 glycoside hydrolase [Candidatus Parcubacteria bacterium]